MSVSNVVFALDNLVNSIIYEYNSYVFADKDSKQKLKESLKNFYKNTDDYTLDKLVESISILVINDLDIGKAYYTKNDGEPTIEKFIVNELKLRQANESRSKMKNQIDNTLLQITGKPPTIKNIRVTNIDSLSAYIDRLITEKIKEYYFKSKQNKPDEALHQDNIIKIILQKITNLLNEIDIQQGYEYIGEKRTFDEEKIIEDVNKILKNPK